MRIGEAAVKGITAITSNWTKYRKKEMKSRAQGAREYERMMRSRPREASQKDVAFSLMSEAYMKASANGSLPASARQIMYQARPMMLEYLEKPLGKDFDQYFTQKLLPEYMVNFSSETASWDVVFDARGHLWEPHTGHEVQLGTIAVRQYLKGAQDNDAMQPEAEAPPALATGFPTLGAVNRFSNVLFIEKEGFMPLLQRARIAERYDLAIMSTKGLSSTVSIP